MEARGQVVGAEMETVKDRQPYMYSYTNRYVWVWSTVSGSCYIKQEQNSDFNIFPSSLFSYNQTEPLLFYFNLNSNTSESNPDFAILISSVLRVFS